MISEGYSSATARRKDGVLRRQIERLGLFRVTVPLRSLLGGAVEPAYTTFSWSSSYTTGGESADIEDMVPTFAGALPLPKGGYTFFYDSAANKILAYTTAGAEVAATTDLAAAIGTIGVVVYGTRDTTRPLYVAQGDEVLHRVFLTAEADLDNAANYWTFDVRRRADGDDFGEELATRTTENHGLEARDHLLLYENTAGLSLAKGDTLLLLASTASAEDDPVHEAMVTFEFQRKVT